MATKTTKRVRLRPSKARLPEQFKLRLYVAGITPRSLRAVQNIKRICETELAGHYDLEVIDLYKQPKRAAQDQIVALPRDDRWNTMARGALRDDLYAAHAALVCDVLKVTGPGTPEQRLAEWAERNEEAVQRTSQTLTEIWETERSSLATLSVAVRAVRSLVASGAPSVHS